MHLIHPSGFAQGVCSHTKDMLKRSCARGEITRAEGAGSKLQSCSIVCADSEIVSTTLLSPCKLQRVFRFRSPFHSVSNPSKEISCAFCTASALRYVRNLELCGLIAAGRLIIQTSLALMYFVKSLTP